MQDRSLQKQSPGVSGSLPPPEDAEDRRALELALQLRPRPLPWRPPPDEH